MFYKRFVKGVVLVIVVRNIEVLSKEWFSSLLFDIKEFCQRSGSRHCGLFYKSFVKGVVLVIVVCYIGVLSKEWFSSLWFAI